MNCDRYVDLHQSEMLPEAERNVIDEGKKRVDSKCK